MSGLATLANSPSLPSQTKPITWTPKASNIGVHSPVYRNDMNFLQSDLESLAPHRHRASLAGAMSL